MLRLAGWSVDGRSYRRINWNNTQTENARVCCVNQVARVAREVCALPINVTAPDQ